MRASKQSVYDQFCSVEKIVKELKKAYDKTVKETRAVLLRELKY